MAARGRGRGGASWRLGGRGRGGEYRGVREGSGEGQGRRPRIGGAAWHGRVGGDHASCHADIGIEIYLPSHGSKTKLDRVTLCQNKNSTTFQL